MLIDPPVTPYSTPAELEAWIVRLRQLREQNPDDAAEIDTHIEQAERWLGASPGRAVVLLFEALANLEDHLDYRPALVALDRLKAEIALAPELFPAGTSELVHHARAIVDDDQDAAHQELWAVAEAWIKRWPTLA